MGIPFSVSWVQDLVRGLLDPQTRELLDIAKEVGPAIVLESDRREWALLKRQLHFAGSLSQAAVVGQLSAVGIRVPEVVDEVAVVYFIKNSSPSVTGDLILGNLGTLSTVTGELAATPAVAALDSRLQRNAAGGFAANSAALIFRAASAGGIGGGTYTLHESLAAGERLSVGQHGYLAVLGPDGFLGLQTQALNLAISMNCWFYERPTRQGRFFV